MQCRWQGLVLNPSLKSNFPLISASASKSFLHTKEWRASEQAGSTGGTFFQIFNQWRAFSKLPRHQSKQAKAQNFYPLNHLPTFPSSIWFFKSKILAEIQKFFRYYNKNSIQNLKSCCRRILVKCTHTEPDILFLTKITVFENTEISLILEYCEQSELQYFLVQLELKCNIIWIIF